MNSWEWGKYPGGEACVRQTDAWCRPGGSPAGTLCAPAGLARQAGSGDSGFGGFGGGGGGGGRTGVQSGEGGHTQDLRNNIGETHTVGFEVKGAQGRRESNKCATITCVRQQRGVQARVATTATTTTFIIIFLE